MDIAKYLNKTFPRVCVKFPKNCKTIKNKLFKIDFYNNKHGEYIIINKMDGYQHSREILKYIEKKRDCFYLEKNKLITNQIPLRWFYIIKDFHEPELEIEIIDYIDYSEINKLNNLTIDIILEKATRERYCSIEINEPEWKTGDGKLSKLTEEFFNYSKTLNSLNHEPYEIYFACEGGFMMDNIFTRNFTQLIPRPHKVDLRGKREYTNKHCITQEDMIIFHLALKQQNISHKFIV